MQFTGTNFIGTRESAEGTETISVVNPATGEKLPGNFAVATDSEVDYAVSLAAQAFDGYRRLCPEHRAGFLDRIGDELMAVGDALLETAHQETALPMGRLTGERARAVDQFRQFAELVRNGSWVDARIDHGQPGRQPGPKPDLRRMLISLGPVAVFGASNFPFAFSVAGGDTAAALAAGCPVIVKAHPAHPGTSEFTARAILKAAVATGVPEGTFSMLHGREATGVALVRHPLLEAAAFTGSRTGGMALYREAVGRPRPIPLFAEMSSVNPVFVLPEALAQRGKQIAIGLAASVTLGVGQFCTNPGLVFCVLGPGLEPFLEQLSDSIAQTSPMTMLHYGIYERYTRGIEQLCSMDGIAVVGQAADGEAAKSEGAARAVRVAYDVFRANPDIKEEVFGPATMVVVADSWDQLTDAARSLEGQLTATVHGEPSELKHAEPLLTLLQTKVGRVLCSGYPTGVEVSPAMQHGGPFPATTDSRSTAVGTAAITRFARPVCFQDFPDELLPPPLQESNPQHVWRLVDGHFTDGSRR